MGKLIFVICFLFLTSCIAGGKKVFVFKPDKSKQCEPATAVSLKDMQNELSGIKVHSSKKSSDGLIRTQVCGNDTGYINVYEISESDLKKAEEKGFKVLENN